MIRILWLMMVVVCGGSKVLVVSPVPSRSHSLLTDSVVKILLNAGHEVTYITHYSKIKSSTRLTTVNISSVDQDDADRKNLHMSTLMQEESPLLTGMESAESLLRHEAVQELLSDADHGYDAVVAVWYFSGLLAQLAALFDCPLIWYSMMDTNWISLKLMHEQPNPAYTTDSLSRDTALETYDLKSRLYRLGRQAYFTARMHYMTFYVEAPVYEELYSPLFRLRDRIPPDYESLIYNGSLLLVNSHPLVGQSLVLPANVKYVGGHHLDEFTKPLPMKLQSLLDSAKHGAILFSLGPHPKSQELLHKVRYQLIQMFEQLEQKVIWIIDQKIDNLPENVFTFKWIPQTSLLNHSNTILFINDGSLTSLIEATFYGVPLIGIPLVSDHFFNIDVAQSRNRAIRVDYSENVIYDLKRAINEVLRNKSYRSNTKITAEIFQNSLVSSRQELLHYILLAISTKGALHLRSPAVHISLIQRLYLDAVVLLLLVMWFISKVVKVIQAHMKIEDEEKKYK